MMRRMMMMSEGLLLLLFIQALTRVSVGQVISPTTTPTTTSTTPDRKVRLAGTNSSCSGRVEVFIQGQWGTVCDDIWYMTNAQVVCRQLGCGPAVSALTFGQGSGPIWMDAVTCSGSESALTECSHPGFGIHNCVHGEDAGVICDNPGPLTPTELVCGREYMEVGLPNPRLVADGLDGSSAHLANRRCSTHLERNWTVWYRVERREGSCGNILRTNGSHAIFSNILFVYPINSDFLAQPLRIPFSCSYPLETEADLNVAIRPYLEFEGAVRDHGDKAQASMFLFRDANYSEPYPAGPVTLPLGSTLHVGVSVQEMERLVVILEDCYSTHSANPDDLQRYFLIQNRCPTDRRQAKVDESGVSLQAHFSALLFLYQEDYRDIYLHCSISLCDQMTSSCSPMCSGRRVRSVAETVPLKPVTIGPITWEQTPE